MPTILTRKSPLAIWQAEYAQQQLQQQRPENDFKLKGVSTAGDQNTQQPLHALGGKALFVKNIERALLAGQGDFAVHSMKDMSVHPTPGLYTTCFGARGNPLDALVLSKQLAGDAPQGTNNTETALSALPTNARIGTSSLRRTALLKRIRPDLQCVTMRGNVATRLKKCDEGAADALILAAAGLERLGYQKRIYHCFAKEVFLPAACQGILAIQCRDDDAENIALLQHLTTPTHQAQAAAEQSLCAALGANCQTPIGAHATLLPAQQLQLTAWVASLDGSVCLQASATGPCSDATRLGKAVAEDLYAQGAEALLQ